MKGTVIRKKRMTGAVALEFLILFPFVISLIYAAGVYGVVFSQQVRMQSAVDRASAAAMVLDRSAADTPAKKAKELANNAMTDMLPGFMGADAKGACKAESGQVVCRLAIPMNTKGGGCSGDKAKGVVASDSGLKQLVFFGGNFPPLPNCLSAEARVAF